jgi:mRNA interferase MazF
MTKTSVTFDAGDLVVVPFPFTDADATKRRPALVLSQQAFNDSSGHLLLAMITGARTRPWPLDVALRDWHVAGLTKPCIIRMKLFTLDERLILRKTGRLSDQDFAAARASLSSVLTGS